MARGLAAAEHRGAAGALHELAEVGHEHPARGGAAAEAEVGAAGLGGHAPAEALGGRALGGEGGDRVGLADHGGSAMASDEQALGVLGVLDLLSVVEGFQLAGQGAAAGAAARLEPVALPLLGSRFGRAGFERLRRDRGGWGEPGVDALGLGRGAVGGKTLYHIRIIGDAAGLLRTKPTPAIVPAVFEWAVLGMGLWGAAVPQADRFAAEVDDSYSLQVNPAGLGLLDGGELRLRYGFDEAGVIGSDGHGFGITGALNLGEGFGVGVGYERAFFPDDLAQDAFRLGIGFGSEWIALGGAFHHLEPLRGRGQDRLDLGMSLRPFRWLGLGGRVADLSENLGPRSWETSLALRFFEGRLLLSGGVGFDTRAAIRNDRPSVGGRIEAEVLKGLRLAGSIDDDGDVMGQLIIDSGYLSTGLFGRVEDDRLQLGAEFVLRSARRRSLIPQSRVAVLDLSGELTSGTELDLLRSQVRVGAYGAVPRLLDRLTRAEELVGLYLRIGPLSVGWATAAELWSGLAAFRASGRRVDCYLTAANDLTYHVATACDTVMMAPPSTLRVDGLASVSLYLGEALARLGVNAEVERIGRYKNAPDQFTRSDQSDEERERFGAYLDTLFERSVGAIAERRGLDALAVRQTIDLAAQTATGAAAAGWIDAAKYPDEAEGFVRHQYLDDVSFVSAFEAARPLHPQWPKPGSIAVVHLDAAITSGRSEASPLGLGRTVGAADVVEALERVRFQHGIAAVVLRVDSPGGDAVASDLIARAVRRLAEVKPVFASFGDVAASGGYYAAAPATRIFAQPTTLTGSIGIYSVKLDLSVLLARLGVGVSVLERGALAADSSEMLPRSPEGDRAMRQALGASYARFLQVVAEGRNMSVEQVHALGEGRIFTGEAAMAAGLVDEMGGYVDALRAAAKVAGHDLDDVNVVELPDPYQEIGDPLSLLLYGLKAKSSPIGLVQTLLGPMARAFDERLALLGSARPLALLPYVVEVE